MSGYELMLILEALTRVHTFDELAQGRPIIAALVLHLGLEPEQAEVLVEGAMYLKQARAESGEVIQGVSYLQ
jgi:hypothetical protein